MRPSDAYDRTRALFHPSSQAPQPARGAARTRVVPFHVPWCLCRRRVARNDAGCRLQPCLCCASGVTCDHHTGPCLSDTARRSMMHWASMERQGGRAPRVLRPLSCADCNALNLARCSRRRTEDAGRAARAHPGAPWTPSASSTGVLYPISRVPCGGRRLHPKRNTNTVAACNPRRFGQHGAYKGTKARGKAPLEFGLRHGRAVAPGWMDGRARAYGRTHRSVARSARNVS